MRSCLLSFLWFCGSPVVTSGNHVVFAFLRVHVWVRLCASRDFRKLLGWAETVGVGYEFDSRFADQVQAVTAADVQRVARKYFANYAAVVLLPKSKSEPGPKPKD